MPLQVEAYTNLIARAHGEGNLVTSGGETGQPQEVRVSKLRWFIIWFKDRLMPSSTRARHVRILAQLEQTIQDDDKCPLKGEGVGGLIGRSFDKSSRNRSWTFLQRLQRVSEQLRSTVDDPLLKDLDGSQMEFTMETYPTKDNFEQMLQRMQRAHEVRSKAALPKQGDVRPKADVKFSGNAEISREEYIRFLKYIHDETQDGKRVPGKNEPQLALAAMLTFKLALPSPTQGQVKTGKGKNWSQVLDGAFYGCRDMDTADRYYRLYQQYYGNNREGGYRERTSSPQTDIAVLPPSSGQVQGNVPSRFSNDNRTEDEITPVVETVAVDEDEGGDAMYQEGIVLEVLNQQARRAKNEGGAVVLSESSSSLETRHCSRLGKLIIWMSDKTAPARSSTKNRAVLQELDRVLKEQFGFSAQSAQSFLDARFPPEVLSDTPLFVDMLSETAGMLRESKESFELLGGTGMVFTADNFPTLERFEMKATSLLAGFAIKVHIKTDGTGAVSDASSSSAGESVVDSQETGIGRLIRRARRKTGRAQSRAGTHEHTPSSDFDRYKLKVEQDVATYWKKYIKFLDYLNKNMPPEQRIQETDFKHTEAEVALSVFLLHEGLPHDQATEDMHRNDVASFSATRGQVIANFTECHRNFSEQTGDQDAAS